MGGGGSHLAGRLTPEERFASLAEELRLDPAVSRGRMFGSGGLKVRGNVFALLVRERLVLKLPAARVDALVAAGEGDRFDPGHGRLMREWISLEPQSPLDWPALAREAREYVTAVSRGARR